jgi:hypothetical protein
LAKIETNKEKKRDRKIKKSTVTTKPIPKKKKQKKRKTRHVKQIRETAIENIIKHKKVQYALIYTWAVRDWDGREEGVGLLYT